MRCPGWKPDDSRIKSAFPEGVWRGQTGARLERASAADARARLPSHSSRTGFGVLEPSGTLGIHVVDMFTSTATWAALGNIILVNIVLSGDNAFVIAMAARGLHGKHQRNAIVWGSAA